ncbi:hypothetical protein X975_06104, partial [Stegodyphus mimosarum]
EEQGMRRRLSQGRKSSSSFFWRTIQVGME